MDTDHDQQTHPNLVEVVTLVCDGDISILHKDVHALTDLVGFGVAPLAYMHRLPIKTKSH